jgi:hypothetical protein
MLWLRCQVIKSMVWFLSFRWGSSWRCCYGWQTKRSPQKQHVSRWVAFFERQLTATQHLINRPWCESLRFESTASTPGNSPQPAPIHHEPFRVQHKIIPLCQRLLCPKLTSSCQTIDLTGSFDARCSRCQNYVSDRHITPRTLRYRHRFRHQGPPPRPQSRQQ